MQSYVRLKEISSIRHVGGIVGPADIADGDRESALPSRALGSRVQACFECINGTGGGNIGTVVVAALSIGVEGRIDDVLQISVSMFLSLLSTRCCRRDKGNSLPQP